MGLRSLVLFCLFFHSEARVLFPQDSAPPELARGALRLSVAPGPEGGVELRHESGAALRSPVEGLWSVATDWQDDWPTEWRHATVQDVERTGDWLLAHGSLELERGSFELRDAYRIEQDLVQVVRRFTWRGSEPVRCTLSARWQAPVERADLLLPGICYHGNPSGVKAGFGAVVGFEGAPGEEALFEEHRYPVPFASLEWEQPSSFGGAALHTLPSRAAHGNREDQWWSLGAIGRDGCTELLLLSGPCAANGQRSVVKALQGSFMAYGDTWLEIPPGAVIEKTFFLQAHPVARRGAGFQTPLRSALERARPHASAEFPSVRSIIAAKTRMALSRWHVSESSAGFRMYPHRDTYVMGWAGQAAAPGYAFLVLDQVLADPTLAKLAQRALDFLSTSPVTDEGFPVRYEPESDQWGGIDPISQGQAMENIARAIMVGRRRADVRTELWESFLKRASEVHAQRILRDDWRPRSTNEGFFASPLFGAAKLFDDESFFAAARKVADHYGARHVDMREPYWGGTLDARCEDKEGAWAGFQAFLAAYDATGEQRYLRWAEHAMDVVLSYTVTWDIDLPAGRLRDHDFKTRGWTVVSAQNQHLDVFGVLYSPQVYRMGKLLGRESLCELADLMFRSCGQLVDPHGSQGEQIQQTNFAQHGDLSHLQGMRGGYSEGWTVFWITAHFLNAAAQFEEMGS